MASVYNISLWLYNKLESDWQSSRIAPLLTLDIIKQIIEKWDTIGDTTLKLKLLPVIFSFNKRQYESLSSEFMKIVEAAMADKDEWVKTLATMISTVTQKAGQDTINFSELSGNTHFKNVFLELKEKLKGVNSSVFYPLETCYLQNSKQLTPEPNSHFSLKKKTPRFGEAEVIKVEVKQVSPVEEVKEREEIQSFRAKQQPRDMSSVPRSKPLLLPHSRKPRKSVEVIEFKNEVDVRDTFERVHEPKTKVFRAKKSEDDSKKRKRQTEEKKPNKKVKETAPTTTATSRFSRKQETTSPLVGNILAQINSLRTNQLSYQRTEPGENPLIVRNIHSLLIRPPEPGSRNIDKSSTNTHKSIPVPQPQPQSHPVSIQQQKSQDPSNQVDESQKTQKDNQNLSKENIGNASDPPQSEKHEDCQ